VLCALISVHNAFIRNVASRVVLHKIFRDMRENEMRIKALYHFAFLLFMLAAFILSGCSRLYAPSDVEVIKAINESGALKDLTVVSPIKILEKSGPKKDGSWYVKVKLTFTYEIKDRKMSPPVEKTPVYVLVKSKDNTGHTVWKVRY
jgi:hypothetical protein